MDLGDTAARLWEARQEGDFCPEWLPGALSYDEALAVQLLILERELATGQTLGGWKVGLTSPRTRASLAADLRPFGYILADRIFASGAAVPAAAMRQPSIEVELCFTVGRPVEGAGVTRDYMARAMSHVSAGFELNERRAGSVKADLNAMAADRMTNWGIVFGSEVAVAGVEDINAVTCRLERDGGLVYEGVSRDELDDHFESLRALAAGLARHGRGLLPGQRIITGAFARFDAAAGQQWRAEYTGIGVVEVRFV